eukprot:TRINITY_DN1511_c0_g1_i2.p1 TRINITY_DN1511_c0_g1~~TRINITY_DN1511_c0_g1_i2.p1  ORF type:complete len:264 (+),score=114.73 TRINITY_DN1511_c0_g1_i2:81-872(+)
MIRRPPRSTQSRSSAASDVYKRQAPWCGHCKALAPEWVKAAKALKGFVKVAAVDMDQHQTLGAPYGVKGFPTIKIFGADKSKPKDYQHAREAAAIAQAAIQEVADTVQARMRGGGSTGPSAVITLTDANFEEKVLKSTDLWLVEFYAPWCGHCKKLEPEWRGAASDLEGKLNLGALDATAEKSTAAKYQVQGFPTIKFFGADKSSPEDYEGGRTKSDIVTWGKDKAVSYTHLRAHETVLDLVCRLLLEKKKNKKGMSILSKII